MTKKNAPTTYIALVHFFLGVVFIWNILIVIVGLYIMYKIIPGGIPGAFRMDEGELSLLLLSPNIVLVSSISWVLTSAVAAFFSSIAMNRRYEITNAKSVAFCTVAIYSFLAIVLNIIYPEPIALINFIALVLSVVTFYFVSVFCLRETA